LARSEQSPPCVQVWRARIWDVGAGYLRAKKIIAPPRLNLPTIPRR